MYIKMDICLIYRKLIHFNKNVIAIVQYKHIHLEMFQLFESLFLNILIIIGLFTYAKRKHISSNNSLSAQ